MTFRLEKNADVAAQEVRDRINRILPLLPRTITQPTIEKQDPDAQPILTMAVTADKPIRDVTEYADKVLRRRLESADGVGQVLVLGGRKRQVNVWVNADQLRAYNLTVNDVSRTLQSQNVDIPGGRIDQGPQSITMRTRGRVEKPEEFGDLVVRQVDGHPVKVSDVARIDDGVAEATTLANIDGAATVLLQIRKQSGTNTVEVVRNVRERLDDVQAALPPGYSIRIVRNQADFIEASIRSVQEHLIVGSLLAAFVVLIFLGNFRSTIIAAISIPTSIIATFSLIWYMGFTLNMLTMLALTLAVGIVIDDAIVVLENIYRFIEEKGMSPMQAAVEGTREIGLAVMATTLSLVAIFAPVGFMAGMVGRFMKSFGLTMAFAVMVSLLVSFTLTPMMCARWLKVKPRTEDEDHHVHDSKHSAVFGPVDRVYTRMLEWSMAHRGIIATLAVLVLFSSVPIFRIVNVNFTPQDDQSEFDVSLRAPEGASLEGTEVIANRVSAAIRRIPEVSYTMVTVAGDSAGTLNTAGIYVRLKDLGDRDRDQFVIMDEVRRGILPPLAKVGVRASLQAPGIAGGGGGGRRPGAGRRDVRDAGAAARRAAARQRHAGRAGAQDSRPGGRGHVAAHRQARSVGAARSAQGRRSRRAGLGCRRGAATAGRRRSGDDLQRGRRAVRGAPAGRRAEPRLRGRHRPAHGAVGAARQCRRSRTSPASRTGKPRPTSAASTASAR